MNLVTNNNLQQDIKQDIPKTIFSTMELWMPIVLLVATTLSVHTTFSAAHPVPRSATTPTVRQNVYSGMVAFGVLLKKMVCFLMSCVLNCLQVCSSNQFLAHVTCTLLYHTLRSCIVSVVCRFAVVHHTARLLSALCINNKFQYQVCVPQSLSCMLFYT